MWPPAHSRAQELGESRECGWRFFLRPQADFAAGEAFRPQIGQDATTPPAKKKARREPGFGG
jgi:hypothetical protein